MLRLVLVTLPARHLVVTARIQYDLDLGLASNISPIISELPALLQLLAAMISDYIAAELVFTRSL